MKSKIILVILLLTQIISAKFKFPITTNNYSISALNLVDVNNPSEIIHSKINDNPNILYLSPYPNSILNMPNGNIIIRMKNIIDGSSVTNNLIFATGSLSGTHMGKVKISDDQKTLLFQSDIPFSLGEFVKVSLADGLYDASGNSMGSAVFYFSIAPSDVQKNISFNSVAEELKNIPLSSPQRVSPLMNKSLKPVGTKYTQYLPTDIPSLYFQSNNPDPGEYFFDNVSFRNGVISSKFLMILDNLGNLFFYKRMPENTFALTMQPGGLITYYDVSKGFFCGMDTTFSVVDSFYCRNNYSTNEHELQILPNGHFLLIGNDFEQIDMSKIVPGGNPNATVFGTVIQELDKDKNVVFQWRSLDHYQLTDATSDIDLTASTVDYIHTNAIELDHDGNYLISNRHLDEITKINSQTGEIIWRFGGKNNQFQLLNDNIWFSHQHDIRRLPNGDITLFDDGNLHESTSSSRALEYFLDEENKTAQLVWSYKNKPDEYSTAMGNVQRLPNGNSIIGWGVAAPTITEITQNGEKLFEMSLPEYVYSYRAFKFNLGNPYYSSFIPKLISPAQCELTNPNRLNFVWVRNKFAQSFHLQISEDSLFTRMICDSTGLKDSMLVISSLKPGFKYYWHVMSLNNNENIGGYSCYSNTNSFSTLDITSIAQENIPTAFYLSQNYPNPFNPSTTIKYDVPKESVVRIKVYNELGQDVETFNEGDKKPGSYELKFNAGYLASGIYIYQIEADDPEQNMNQEFIQTKKMILLK